MQFPVSSWQVLSIPYCHKELWSADNIAEPQCFRVLLQSLALRFNLQLSFIYLSSKILRIFGTQWKNLLLKTIPTYLERFSHLLSCFSRTSSPCALILAALEKIKPEQIKFNAHCRKIDMHSVNSFQGQIVLSNQILASVNISARTLW